MHVGQYDIQILKSIGQGRLGEVFLALSHGQGGLEKRVAIKRLWESHSANAEFMVRFKAAVQAYIQLGHPNLVEIYDLNKSPEGYYLLVMAHVDGLSLRRVNATFRSAGRLLPLGLSLRLVTQLCAGLHALHNVRGTEQDALGVVHRNVRPANIMVSTAGVAQLMEVGLDHDEGAKANYGIGGEEDTLLYRAPEQEAGGMVDATADQYAVALIMAELLLGRPVYDAPTPALLREQVLAGAVAPSLDLISMAYPELHPILERALSPSPEDRFLDLASMSRAIEGIMPPSPRDIDLGTLIRLMKRGEAVAEIWGRSIPWHNNSRAMPASAARPEEDDSLPPEPVAMRMFVLDSDRHNPGEVVTRSELRAMDPNEDPSLPPDPMAINGPLMDPADVQTLDHDASPDYWDNVRTVQVKAVNMEAAEAAAVAAVAEATPSAIHQGQASAAPASVDDLESDFFGAASASSAAVHSNVANVEHEETRRRRGSPLPWFVGLASAAALLLFGVGYANGWFGGPSSVRVASKTGPVAQQSAAASKADAPKAALPPTVTPIQKTQSAAPTGNAQAQVTHTPASETEAPLVDAPPAADEAAPEHPAHDQPVEVAPSSADPPGEAPADAAPAAGTTAKPQAATRAAPPLAPQPVEPPAPQPTAAPEPVVIASVAKAPPPAPTTRAAAPARKLEPVAPPAEVSFGSFPAAAAVTLSGRAIPRNGRQPTEMAPGTYQVAIRAADGRETSLEITLKPGKVHRFFYNFETSVLEDKSR